MLAGRKQLAEDLLQDLEVVDLAAGHRRQRLVQQRHALLGPVAVDQARPQVGERHRLQVGVTEPTSRRKAARDGAVADDHQVYVPERARHADRTRPVRGLAVRRIRALPVLDRAGKSSSR